MEEEVFSQMILTQNSRNGTNEIVSRIPELCGNTLFNVFCFGKLK